MWNYAPLASGLHRLPSKFSLAASLHLSSLEKSHEVSISKAECPHVFPVSILFAGFDKSRSARGSWELAFLPLASGQHPPLLLLTERFYCERADFCLSPLFLSLFVLHSTFSFHHTAVITHTHTLSTSSLFIQSLQLWEKGSPEVTEALWFQYGMQHLNEKSFLSLQKCPRARHGTSKSSGASQANGWRLPDMKVRNIVSVKVSHCCKCMHTKSTFPG